MVSLSFLVSSPCAPRKRNRTVRQDSKRPSGAESVPTPTSTSKVVARLALETNLDFQDTYSK